MENYKGHLIDEDGNKVIPENELENYFECRVCGKLVDMRNLGEVFEHEH